MKEFYGLTENPFALTPDPKFLYWSPTHRETFQLLIRSQQSPKGIMVVTGARGTGKTTLLQAFANVQEPRTRIVFLPHAASSVDDLFVLLAQQMGLESATQPTSDQRSQLNAWLRTRVQHGEKISLLLDNAHEWSESLLAEIEMLARLGAPTHNLFHIILAGSLSLPDHLMAPKLASLRARIEGMVELPPFDLLDTQSYIHQRLTVAGWFKGALFDPAAVEVIYRYAQGVPRAINQLCSQALLAGFAAQMPRIDAELIRHVAARMGLHEPAPARPAHAAPAYRTTARRTQSGDTAIPSALWPSTIGQPRNKMARRRPARRARALLPLGVIVLMAVGSVLGLGGWLQGRHPLLALAPPVIDRRLAATPEPQLASGRTLEAAMDTTASAVQSDPALPVTREATDGRAHLSLEPEKQAEPSPPETSPSTASAKRLIATALLAKPVSQGTASATPSETLQRPAPPPGTTRLTRTPKAQPHKPAQTLARRGPTAPPALPPLSEPVAHDTPGVAERSAPSPQGQAQLFQDDPPAAPSPHEATNTRFSGQASDAPVATQPRMPLWPLTEVPGEATALPKSPEPPPQEAVRPAQRVPTTTWETSRPVPARPLQGHTVEIHTGLARASVLINGQYMGHTPVVIHLPLGVYTMAIDNPGYARMTWKMHVDPGGVALHMARSRGWSWSPHYMPRVLAY